MFNIKRTIFTLVAALCLWAGIMGSAGATTQASLENAAPGPYPGTIYYTWHVNDNLSSGDKFYIQYSTWTGVTWSTTSAQIAITTTTAIAIGLTQGYVIGGLNTGRSGAGASQSPTYTVKIWVVASSVQSAVSAGAAAVPNTPVFASVSAAPYGGGMRALESNLGPANGGGIAVDGLNNIYLVNPFNACQGCNDIEMVLRKYNSAGALQWVRLLNSAYQGETDLGRAVAVNQANGDVYITGGLSNGSNTDIMVAKYSTDGELKWLFTRPGAIGNDLGQAIVYDNASGYVYAGGYATETSTTGFDSWLAKISSTGATAWERTYNSAESVDTADNISGLALDASGYIYASGGAPYSGVWSAMQIAKFNSTGDRLSVMNYKSPGNGYTVANGLAVNPVGYAYAYLCGFEDRSDINQGNNLVLHKFDLAQSTIVWTRTYDNPNTTYNKNEGAYGCAVDKFGAVYVAGAEERMDLGQQYNAIYFKYTADGQLVSSRTYASAGKDEFYGVAISTTGDVLLAGQFGDSYGLYSFPQAGGNPSQLGAYAGPYTGSVQLSWNYPQNISNGTKIYVQYSTSPAVSWSTATAQVDITTVAVSVGTGDGYLVRGLPASRDAGGNSTTPTYYFMAWIENIPMGAPVYAQARTPALNDNVYSYPQARFTYSDNLANEFATAMDGAGNIYQAYSLNSGANMEGGWALRKYDKAGGRYDWTRFYNSTAPTVNTYAMFTIKALAVSSGTVYVAGAMKSNPDDMDDAYLAKIMPNGSLAWSRVYSGENTGMDYANALALDAAGNIYLAGRILDSGYNAALLKKISPTGADLWTSTKNASGGMGSEFNGVAVTTSAVYAAGRKYISGSDDDIWLVKYNPASPAPLWETTVSSDAPTMMDAAYAVAAGPNSDIYVAGQFNTGSTDAWLGKFIDYGNSVSFVAASTYNSVGNGMDVNYGVTYYGGELYTAGYEMRTDLEQAENIRVTKVDPVTLATLWTKTFDSGSNYSGETARNVMLDGSGIFAGTAIMDKPGIYTFVPPSFSIGGRPGAYPGTAEIYWTSTYDLPIGSAYYFQASLSAAGPWSEANAQTVFQTTIAVASGMYQSYSIGGLDSSRDGSGAINSPNYYFRVWAEDTVVHPLDGQATSYANTPGIQDSVVTYPDSKVWSISNSYGYRNRSARDVSGNLYVVSNSWGNGANMFVLRKYRTDMTTAWTKFFSGRQGEYVEATAVKIDHSGNILVAGSRNSGSEGGDILVVKYDAAGVLLWARNYDYAHGYDSGRGIDADENGNIYILGTASSGSGTFTYVAKTNAAGGLLASNTLLGNGTGNCDPVGLVYDSANSVVYVTGSIYNTGSGGDAFVTKFNSSLVTQSTLTITSSGNNWDQAGGVDVDGSGNFYTLANIYDPYGTGSSYSGLVAAKYNSANTQVWASTYIPPGNNSTTPGNIKLDSQGSVYVTGSESRWDINQGDNLLIRKFGAADGAVIWTRSFNGSGSSSERGWDIHVDTAGYVYATGEFSGGFGVYRYRQLVFSTVNPMLTVYVSSTVPMANTGLVVLPFTQTGGIDPQLISVGATDSNGKYAARLPAGFQYFIGISVPGYKPTMKDQMMDPYGSFMVNLIGDTTKQYRLYPKPAAETAYTLTITISSGMVSGDYAMAEVFYTKTGDKLAYGIGRSTAANLSFMAYNVPPAAGGVYGININVPGKNKVTTIYMDKTFPGTDTYTVDMTSAVAMMGFSVGASTVPPSFQSVVRSTWGAPLEGARVELSKWALDLTNNNCGGPCSHKIVSYENLTDVNGMAVFYNIPPSTGSYSLEIKKQGYGNFGSGGDSDCSGANPWGICVSTNAYTVTRDFMLTLATYTLTGVLKYNGVPLPNANVAAWGDNNWASGQDSYANSGNAGIRNDANVKTGADGAFTITGLTDGNVRLNADFMGNWRDLNAGNNTSSNSDDLRVTISSASAVNPAGSAVCLPGKVWVLNSSGNCLAADNLEFNMSPSGGNLAGSLSGTLTFVTTYTITELNPLEIPASSPVVVMAMQNCNNDCQNRQLGFTSFSGILTSNSTSYTIALSSGLNYWATIYSTEWGMLSSFNDQFDLSSTDTIRMDFTLTRSGALKGIVKNPDGTNFKPVNGNRDDPTSYWADIEVRGQNTESGNGTGLDDSGAFGFPNLAPGKYNIYLKPQGAGFRWPPVTMEGVSVTVGQTTQVKLQLADGMVVQPQIFGLPALSTSAWNYTVLGVPSGFTMNQKNITDLFFSQPMYAFNYSTTTASWDKKYMIPGQYDFYLVIGAGYNPGDKAGEGRVESYYQFANFIGQARNVSIQKSESNPNLGLYNQPIPINILGSIGQGQIGGRITGGRIFSDADFDKIFANFDSEIMPVIPVVMLYDTAGDLRGFGHALPDETAFSGFENGIMSKDKNLVLDALRTHPLRYLVWGLPPGRYTAVFANPNYPPVAKEIELPADAAYNFNFDSQNIVAGSISGIVRVAVSSVPLENAQVYLKHRTVEKFAKTNAAGEFSFSNLPTGIYRLEVSRDGFVKVGQKTSLAGNDSVKYYPYLEPSVSRLIGAVYLGKFPSPSTRAGIRIVAYDETQNVAAPSAYLPKLEAQTDESGNYTLTGVIPRHNYKISAFYEGKTPDTLEKTALEGDTILDDIVLRDIPPQISVKVKKSEIRGKVDVQIKSPRELVTTPVCKYNPGQVFDPVSAVSLALVPGPNNSYEGRFAVSSNQQYYLIDVAAGDGDNKMEKSMVYDQVSDAKTEQYIQDAAIAGGEVQMDTEQEEYSGIELDAGGLTTSSGTADFSNLVGGFFSALPSVRTIKTAKGNLTITSAIQNLMASEVYNMDLTNAQANKPFTLTLKYDKEKALNTNGLRIYQYDDASRQWKAVPGNYTVDPMSGVVSVDIVSLGLAYKGTGGTDTPLGRKSFQMSAIRNGSYVPSGSTSSSQTGKFAVFTSNPPTGTPAFSSSFVVFNLPNPFNLEAKEVTLSADANGAIASPYSTRGTVIKYNLPPDKAGALKFVIYNLAGEKVRTIDEGARAANGVYYSEWDGKNDNNKDCASGVYFMLTYLDGKSLSRKALKMVIIK